MMYFSTTFAVSSASVFLSFLSQARGAALQSRALSGQATFYGGNLHGGSCSFSTYTLPSGVYGTALSDSNWDNAANCGACISVTGPGGNSITAMIVDECPGCGLNHLDLFPDAFAALADPSTGVIPVTWSYIDCPISTPIQLHNKEGVSQYWFSMQVVNAIKPVASLSVSTDGGETWTATDRQSYNFFQYSSGFGTATVDVMVSSDDGDEIVVRNVQVTSDGSMTADLNFGTSGAGSGNGGSDPAPASSSPPSVAPTPTPTPTPAPAPTPTPATIQFPATTSAHADPPVNTVTAAVKPETTIPTLPGGVFKTYLSSSAATEAPSSTCTDISASSAVLPTSTLPATSWTTIYKPVTTTTVPPVAPSTTTVYVYETCAV